MAKVGRQHRDVAVAPLAKIKVSGIRIAPTGSFDEVLEFFVTCVPARPVSELHRVLSCPCCRICSTKSFRTALPLWRQLRSKKRAATVWRPEPTETGICGGLGAYLCLELTLGSALSRLLTAA